MPGKRDLSREEGKDVPLVDQEDLIRTQQVLLVLPLAIYTRYSTRLSHVNLESIYDLLPQLCYSHVTCRRSMYVHYIDVPMSDIHIRVGCVMLLVLFLFILVVGDTHVVLILYFCSWYLL